MEKRAVALALAGLLLGTASPIFADEMGGGFCKVAEARFSNAGKDSGILKQKLWGYAGTTLPADPVMGVVDIGCADRGVPRSALQDFGKRVWFNVSGPAGGPLASGKLSVSDAELDSAQKGEAGISIDGLSLYGVITPQHDCIYKVQVWQTICPEHEAPHR